LDLLDVVTAKMDKASVGQQAAGIERHPEVWILLSRILEALTMLGLILYSVASKPYMKRIKNESYPIFGRSIPVFDYSNTR